MKKLLLGLSVALTSALAVGDEVWAGPVYDLAYHVSSATLKVSGDIRVAASSSSANTPTITLSGPSGITTSKPITTSSSMTANAFYGDGSHLTGVATVIPNTFVSSVTFSSNTYTVGYSSATKYYGDGSSLTGLSGAALASTQTFTGSNTFTATGAGGTAISSLTIPTGGLIDFGMVDISSNTVQSMNTVSCICPTGTKIITILSAYCNNGNYSPIYVQDTVVGGQEKEVAFCSTNYVGNYLKIRCARIK